METVYTIKTRVFQNKLMDAVPFLLKPPKTLHEEFPSDLMEQMRNSGELAFGTHKEQIPRNHGEESKIQNPRMEKEE